MSVTEYRDKYIELSCYDPADIADNEGKQDHFRNGLSGAIKYQLLCHTFASFQELVDNAIKVEHARKGDGRDEKEDGLAGTVKQQPPPLCISTGDTFPFWRPDRQLWVESVPAPESADSADSTHRTAGAMPQLPSEPSKHSRRYACEEHQLCSYC